MINPQTAKENSNMSFPHPLLEDARRRLSQILKETPLLFDESNNIWLKMENHQITGSFKIRGVLNKVLSLERLEIEKGIVAASAGNHGQGIAFAARQVGTEATVFASETAVPSKIEQMKYLGARVVLVPGGYNLAENNCKKMCLISKCNMDFSL